MCTREGLYFNTLTKLSFSMSRCKPIYKNISISKNGVMIASCAEESCSPSVSQWQRGADTIGAGYKSLHQQQSTKSRRQRTEALHLQRHVKLVEIFFRIVEVAQRHYDKVAIIFHLKARLFLNTLRSHHTYTI